MAAPTAETKNNKAAQFEEDDIVTNGATTLWGTPARRSKTGNWKACWLIFGCEVCERVAYYAISSNLAKYLFQELDESLADSATNVNNWSGTLFLAPLLGAFLADAVLGRYLTLAIFMCIYLISLVLLTMSVSIPSLQPHAGCISSMLDKKSCPPVTPLQSGFLYFALYLMAIGAGGIKPNVTSFAGDQFDEEDPKEAKRKMSFLNWWFVSISSGNLFSVSVLIYIQVTYGWMWGWGGATLVVVIATFLFFAGKSNYRIQKPAGSPFTRVAQVIVAAARNWRLAVPSNADKLFEIHDKESQSHIRKLPHTKEFTFLDKAAVIRQNGGDENPWRLCTVTQVEEVKLLVRVLPIWVTNLIFSSVFAQVGTLFLNQGDTMERHVGSFNIPAASFPLFITLTICVILPLYDRFFVPMARRITGNERGITMLQRIGIGQVVSTASIAIAALVERRRLSIAAQHGLLDAPEGTTVPMSAFWLLPQYALTGVCEVFISVGQNEFFYDQAPDSMRSVGAALYLSTISIGSFISSLLVEAVVKVTGGKGKNRGGWINDNLNRGHIDYFYWLLTGLSLVNLVFYVYCAKWYTYKNVHGDTITSSNTTTTTTTTITPLVSYDKTVITPTAVTCVDENK